MKRISSRGLGIDTANHVDDTSVPGGCRIESQTAYLSFFNIVSLLHLLKTLYLALQAP